MVDAALSTWVLDPHHAEATRDGQAVGWAVTALNAPVDLLDDPHFAARGFWVDVEHPAAGALRQPGAPFRMARRLDACAGPPPCWASTRPRSGRGGRTAAAPRPHAAPAPRRTAPPAPAPPLPPAGHGHEAAALPLEGMRVLDLTVVWAGPYATMLLADLGAEVIRVDNPWVFPTATRGAMPRPAAGAGAASSAPSVGRTPTTIPGSGRGTATRCSRPTPGTSSASPSTCARPAAVETFLRLVEQSDVVVENNSARVLDQLGVGWDVLPARNPRLIVRAHAAAMGLSGPYRDFLGFGVHFEALCGLTVAAGLPRPRPVADGARLPHGPGHAARRAPSPPCWPCAGASARAGAS